MGLLDWFWRRGSSGSPEDLGDASAFPTHGAGVPSGSGSEGSPVGVSDPGSLSGDDADEVVAWDESDEATGDGTPAEPGR
jgi:hypothetical protein